MEENPSSESLYLGFCLVFDDNEVSAKEGTGTFAALEVLGTSEG